MKLIAGPCQHENLEHSLKIATKVYNITQSMNIDYWFKASFDKANRTHGDSARGQGLERTLTDFASIKQQLPGIKTLTDVHDVQQVTTIVEQYSDSVDVLQIPAFLCRQTDLITSACESGMTVNIKKGQFLAPWDVSGLLSKTQHAEQVWITDRGTCFGYNNLIVDFTGLEFMIKNYDCDIFLDITHSVQKPSGQGTSSGGNREYAPGLGRAAAALGVENFFMEVHDNPESAPSDGSVMIELDSLETVIQDIYNHYSLQKQKY